MTTAPMTTALLRIALDVLDLRLVTYRGCLIRESGFDQSKVDYWLANTNGDVHAVESVVNHVHLYDLVEEYVDAEFAALEEVGRRIAQLWTEILRARYPEHRAVVTFASEPDEYGPTVSLYSAV